MCFKKSAAERPEMPHVCRYCDKSTLLTRADKVLCRKKGIVNVDGECKKFRYDPLKRVPVAPPPLVGLNPDDIV